VLGTSGSTRREPSLTTMFSAWSTRSKSIWNTRSPLHGIGLVVRPVAVTYSVTCAQSGSGGASLRRIFPAIWVQRWSVSHVSRQASSGSSGHSGVTRPTVRVRYRPVYGGDLRPPRRDPRPAAARGRLRGVPGDRLQL